MTVRPYIVSHDFYISFSGLHFFQIRGNNQKNRRFSHLRASRSVSLIKWPTWVRISKATRRQKRETGQLSPPAPPDCGRFPSERQFLMCGGGADALGMCLLKYLARRVRLFAADWINESGIRGRIQRKNITVFKDGFSCIPKGIVFFFFKKKGWEWGNFCF